LARRVLSFLTRMASALAEEDDLHSWHECGDCGLLQVVPEVPDGDAASCVRCNKTLRRAASYSLPFAFACSALSAVLLALALDQPLVQMNVVGREGSSTLTTGPNFLWNQGVPALAVVVFLTVLVAPFMKLALMLVVLGGTLAPNPPRGLAWLFGWLERLSPFAMIEVFLLGSFVAYTRLRDLAPVHVGPALLAIGGVMIAMIAADATLDRAAVWAKLGAKTSRLPRNAAPRRDPKPEPGPPVLACHECGRVERLHEGEPCSRCSHPVFHRKTGSLPRVWALTLAAGLLYIPANVLPVMTVLRFGKGGPKTILGGVVELAQDRMWPLAALVLTASILVPVLKLVSLVVLLFLTHRGSNTRLSFRTRLYRFIQVIGRWSMIDIFMLSILVGIVRFGFIATVTPGMGAVAFCAVVILTMFATETFDPRLMWDAARCNEGEPRALVGALRDDLGERRERSAAR
jgi:paraquat-inducible protein A